MAIKKIIEIDVEQVKAMGGLDALQQSLQETESKSASLKTELKKLKDQLAQLPEGSVEYNKIAKQAGEVSDKIGDINTRIKNLGSDTKNIDAVVQGTQALSGAFTVATSASALFGSENKELQETMLKVESAIGLTVGIQSIANALQKESALAIGLSTVATKIQTGAQVIYATVVGTTTGALKALRVALVSTGVGALVVALGFLVAKMTESKEATKDNEEALKSLTEAQKAYENSLRSEIAGIENSTKARVLRAKIAGKSEAELREIEKNGEKERAATFDTELKRIDDELKNRKLSDKEYKKLIEDRNILGDESVKLAQDRDSAQLDFELGIADKKRADKKKANDDARTKAEKDAEDLKAKREKDAEDLKAFRQKITDANLEQFDIDIENKNLQIEKLAEIGKKALDQEEADALKSKEIAEEVARNKEAQLQGNISNLEAILSIGGKKFAKIQKALAISEVVRDTIRAVNAATGNEIKVPAFIGTIPNPVKPASLASTILGITGAVAKGAASVAAITSDSKSVGGGSTPSGGASGGGVSATPQFNLVGQSSTNQLTATIAGQQNRPVQTYVVGSQVTSQQSLDRNAVANSVFG